MWHVSDIAMAYIAGLLDGEGCLSLTSRNPKAGIRWVRVVCEINNTKREALDWIVDTVKFGRVYEKPRKYGRTYTLVFNATEARKLLPYLTQFLIIKKEQAKLLLEYFTTIDNNKNTKDPIRKQQVDSLHDKFRVLNRRGLAA